ncbi:hypothetical protein SAMN06265222_10885 [Neorhodopirellula lusitana]|uniref:Uncharacterized protein n=1 Tax=Neorhodopirellula lusitana TaxID=445327 RepID=A0ABY1QAR2_9BACT|nr:hypothetical protein [Neorhodopirellula lusitana]SMP63474.1 hypothetical protein SAMN06265222_10885 [Neorhodopirellula lusitana]
MVRVDAILFSNVTTAIQRTGNLTGGAIRGLPNGMVVGGLDGLQSLGAEMAEVQKDVRKGQIGSALSRVRQMEMQFNGAKGRWNGMVGSMITGARSGRQNLSMQKLNELKNAQGKMTQLTGPVNKTFRDLIYALDHAQATGGPDENAGQDENTGQDEKAGQDENTAEANSPEDSAEIATEPKRASEVTAAESTAPVSTERIPAGFERGVQLKIVRDGDQRNHIEPKLVAGQTYLIEQADSSRVVRITEIRQKSIWISEVLSPNTQQAGLVEPDQSGAPHSLSGPQKSGQPESTEVSSSDLKQWLKQGMWQLDPR